jgi:hypothetical protein|uniref:Uncharacterized protein n=1 Tax=Podoviridae sp. ctz6O13 TaxID=2827757 RepID=A0A8S5TKJ6_9CAUD|nr:MAG TPA: hypothetical protein [Podoviridae sp. ctz6O13]
MRQRFSAARVCSSENYTQSRKVHKAYLDRRHEENACLVAEITATIVVKPRYFTKCFGRLMEITEAEAMRLDISMVITK